VAAFPVKDNLPRRFYFDLTTSIKKKNEFIIPLKHKLLFKENLPSASILM
jgi:hypothetical protein